MKRRNIFLILIILLVSISGCSSKKNYIYKINKEISNDNGKFVSISLEKDDNNIIGNILENKNNTIYVMTFIINKDDINNLDNYIKKHNNKVSIIYKEYKFKEKNCYVTEWRKNNNKENSKNYILTNYNYEDLVQKDSFYDGPRGIAIKHNKVNSIDYIDEKNIGGDRWKVYEGKFDLRYDSTAPLGYKGKYRIFHSKDSQTVFELYDIDNNNTFGKKYFYRRFWYGNKELILKKTNRDFVKVFLRYYTDAKFSMFLD